MKFNHKLDGSMSLDGHIPDQLKFNPDGTVGTASVPDLATAPDDTLVPLGLIRERIGLPLFFRSTHFGTRETLAQVFNGTARANDGDTVLASTHPKVVLGVMAGLQASCSEEDWQADPYKRGMWSRGNATVIDGVPYGWVRMPDMNQVKPGSLPPPFARGGADTLVGNTEDDRIRNITGSTGGLYHLVTHTGADSSQGAISFSKGPGGSFYYGSVQDPNFYNTINFNAADSVGESHVGPENSPWTLRGVSYSIIANGVQNEAAINAAALSAALDIAKGKIATLELASQEVNADLRSNRFTTELLWSGLVGNVQTITLSRELLDGEMFMLTYGVSTNTQPAIYLPSISPVGSSGGALMWVAAAGANTSIEVIKPTTVGGATQIKLIAFTSGYSVTSVRAIKGLI